MALKHFTKDKYNSIGDALLDIRKELQRLQPVDSGSVAWEQTETGMSAHVGDGGVGGSMPAEASDEGAAGISGGSVYNGYFKLVDMTTTENGVTTYKVGVVNGKTFDGVTSGPSICKTWHKTYAVPCKVFTLENKSDTYYAYVVHTLAPVAIHIELTTKQKYSDDGIVYKPLGACTVNDTNDTQSILIEQYHESNILDITVDDFGGYMGQFKAVWKTEISSTDDSVVCTGVRIVNGGYLDNSRCGGTDIGGYIPASDIKVPPDNSVCLCAYYNDSNSIVVGFELSSNLPKVPSGETAPYYYIASYLNGILRQTWVDGYIYFGSRYVI